MKTARIAIMMTVIAAVFFLMAAPALARMNADSLPEGSGVLVGPPVETVTPPSDSGQGVQGSPTPAPTPPPSQGDRGTTDTTGGQDNGTRTRLPKTGGDQMVFILSGLLITGFGITGTLIYGFAGSKRTAVK